MNTYPEVEHLTGEDLDLVIWALGVAAGVMIERAKNQTSQNHELSLRSADRIQKIWPKISELRAKL